MNDGKFKIALICKIGREELSIPPGSELALVKISNGKEIPEDEPIFILRARDEHALSAIKAYEARCKVGGCNDYQRNSVAESIKRFEQWREKNPLEMKQPGITRGA